MNGRLARRLVTVVLVSSLPAANGPIEHVSTHRVGYGAVEPRDTYPVSSVESNGCSFVLDSYPRVFDFRDACIEHDHCYVNSTWPRKWCDSRFAKDMTTSCTKWWITRETSCKVIACLYYMGVREYGELSSTIRGIRTPLHTAIDSAVKRLDLDEIEPNILGLLSLIYQYSRGRVGIVSEVVSNFNKTTDC